MGNQYKQLTLAERYQSEAWNSLSISAREIGKMLQRGNKSISIELLRCPIGSYGADQAHRHTFQKRTFAKNTLNAVKSAKI
ncbi:hypothetical protein ERW52_02065 [Aliivibrio finisterrensis]|uniref:Transposase IS30-like HTH domain-containing protein n=1 Tax=Aliivibrio finisterrensis TaxID=511998 RepID=A0A4Q5KXY8_9GAMM|nr:hypothetical protein ERW56_11835 [Aliivibrio finisterrensis]RYU54729.1 hypothetical protein ERW57_00305 [Aliivibrio finisterrensis]RYU57661.1 hypothetical protein ERW50_11245 [Aliivibrio finisterrensis]RYU66888.1 hypothetical protein ERW53_01865 [Aliivibrio finisterrensis]RYU83191.1 hypothetical protein ERW55_12055 [Aliivibrio finisterrensis]